MNVRKRIGLVALIVLVGMPRISFSEEIEIGGMLETEIGISSTHLTEGNPANSSDMVLTTVQLGFAKQYQDNILTKVSLLYEQGETDPVDIDEAMVSYEYMNWSIIVGRQYLPFGNYESQMVSDPLTLALGETRAESLLVGYVVGKNSQLNVQAFLFNGTAKHLTQEDHVDDWGVALHRTSVEGVSAGISVISNMASTDAVMTGGVYNTKQMGLSAFVQLMVGPLTLASEVVGALSQFENSVLDANGDGRGDQPVAWNSEIACVVSDTTTIAASVGSTRQLEAQPVLQLGFTILQNVIDIANIGLEYMFQEYEGDLAATIDGTTIETTHQIILKAGIDF